MQEIATSTFLSQQFLLKWKVITLLDIFRISEFQTASNFFFFFFFEVSDVQWLFPPLHSLYPLTKRLSKHVSTIFWKGGGEIWRIFFGEGAWWERVISFRRQVSGLLEIHFYWLLFDLLFTCRQKDVSLVIFHYVFCLFCLLKYCYFINRISERKSM